MTDVFLLGRKLPAQDFEGDDFTPGAGGSWVTCTDTALGRMVSYATNARIDKDGRVYRASIPGNPGGITLPQAAVACQRVAGLPFVIPPDWQWQDVLNWLRLDKGLVVQGWYANIPRPYRFQKDPSNFGHAMFISHFSSTSGMRVWDPLDANTSHHGQWIPASMIRSYMEQLASNNHVNSLYCGYVSLQHL